MSDFPQTLAVACGIIGITVCDALQGDSFTAIRTSQIQVRYPEFIFIRDKKNLTRDKIINKKNLQTFSKRIKIFWKARDQSQYRYNK